MPRSDDHVPDPAALDELTRAFADDAEDPVEPGDDTGDPTAPSDEVPSAEPEWPDELVIVEQDPASPAEPPTVIRIDDYGDPVTVGSPSQPADPPAPSPTDPTAPSPADPTGDDADAESAEPIVIAIDDELPDAVYVEGSLEAGTSRTIVFIEDDESEDAFGPLDERDVRRGIEPRLRERRVAVKRAEGRRRLKWVAVVVGAVLLVVGALAVLGSPLFAVRDDQLTVTGNVYTDPERLQAIIDDLVGTPVLLVDSQGIEDELEAIPWVDEARVRTRFPHAASIEIRERAAMTTFQGPDGWFRVLDRDGRVLDVIEKYPFAYVLLGGPDPVDLEPGQFAPRGYAAASELAKNLTGTVRGRVERIDVTADGSRLVMWLDDGSEVRFGEARDLFTKLVRLETVLASGERDEPGLIDVSTREVVL